MTTLTTPFKKRTTHKITKEEMQKMREKDHKMVEGIFRCLEPSGGMIPFSFKKYEGDPVLKYEMEDGKTYTVPYMVAKHLNKECNYPKHSHVLDADGNPSVQVGKLVQRCTFESLEFQG